MSTFVDHKQLEYAYLAGIIDGEGHIILHNQLHAEFSGVNVGITQKHKAFLESILEQFPGGHIYDCHGSAWSLTWRNAGLVEGILTKVLPYLKLKHELASIMILLCRAMPTKGKTQTDQQRLLRYKLEAMFCEAVERRREEGMLESKEKL